MQRAARRALPQHGGLALVGDADGGDLGGVQSGLTQGLPRDGELVAPDLDGVVLDPARLRVNLPQFLLGHGPYAARGIEDDGA